MTSHWLISAALVVLASLANGADIDMVVTSTLRTVVNKDLSNTYGLKFCLKSDNGVLLTFGPKQGVYNAYTRMQVEIAKTGDMNVIRAIASSSVAAKNYETKYVNPDIVQCFWILWPDNWYMVGAGNEWGKDVMMNYRNVSQSPFGGVFAQVKSSGNVAYLTIVDEAISKADAQSKLASALYVPPVFVGPVKLSNDANEATTVTLKTVAGAPYQEVVGVDLSGVTAISLKTTTNTLSYNGYVLLYDKNNPDLHSHALEFNAYRYGFGFAAGIGVDTPRTWNVNNYGYVNSGDGVERSFWISFAAQTIAIGMGETTGEGTVCIFTNPNPFSINSLKIKSNDVDVVWHVPKRNYVA